MSKKKLLKQLKNSIEQYNATLSNNFNALNENIKSFFSNLQKGINELVEIEENKNSEIEELEKVILELESKNSQKIEELLGLVNNQFEYIKKRDERFFNSLKELENKILQIEDRFFDFKEIESERAKTKQLEIDVSKKNEIIKKLEKELEQKDNEIVLLKEKVNNFESLQNKYSNLNLQKEKFIEKFQKEHKILKEMLKSDLFRSLNLEDDIVSLGKVIGFLKSPRTFYEKVFQELENNQKQNKKSLDEVDINIFKKLNEYFNKEIFINLDKLTIKRDRENYKDINDKVDFEQAIVLLPPMRIGKDKKRGLVSEDL